MATERGHEIGRRSFLLSAGSLAAAPLLGGMATPAAAQASSSSTPPAAEAVGRRRLGSLEVSSIGLGVQNMSRTYQTTVPSRPGMINIIRTAFDRGVTFFDAAEAYGPHEVERILGEGVAPIRNSVAITSKFGWNIDLETGERRPGLNSRPAHIKLAVAGMLRRLRTDRIDLLYQHRVDPQVPIEDASRGSLHRTFGGATTGRGRFGAPQRATSKQRVDFSVARRVLRETEGAPRRSLEMTAWSPLQESPPPPIADR
jgi:hypothetical protein